jgi:MoaA/NifB/PqqE/SkfB family radical SAM enzyme
MIDTVRVILFLDCNLHCQYCCNNVPKYRSQFQEKSITEIDFDKYKNVCITGGGEPFLRKGQLYFALANIPAGKPIYLYTNGMLITDNDVELLKRFNIKGITIGLHLLLQPGHFNRKLPKSFPVRYRCLITKRNEFLAYWPLILNEANLRGAALNDCGMPNEDWILLKETL